MDLSAACPVHIDLLIEAGDWESEEMLETIATKAIEAAFSTSDLSVIENTEVSLVFTDDAHIQELNKMWRQKDKPTNVLSFPGDDKEEPPYGPLLGDIIIAKETLKREAVELDIPFEHHLTHLIVHGTLHLFGYDHQIDEEAEEMEAEERLILAKLQIPDPYKDAPLKADN
ncbi:Endoribonuclease YbeY [Pseudovibrio axinellae]|uniref:Endoribonuclease YbeY n=1 Tax=Pseudovibrio axinellae TaxID=989403 RepID=A0A165Z861_9HYPH|nr:rRNA maturation RNase YbeY [Pseudovibrio axinellae]KZL19591.1 Endoribonuclease YbeY [Pseudovibrio axinellae]SEQ33301.1 probable rRNA maturation factor [Pseudovibrio axinellae]